MTKRNIFQKSFVIFFVKIVNVQSILLAQFEKSSHRIPPKTASARNKSIVY